MRVHAMKYEKESAGHRHERLQTSLLEELGAIVRDDVSDPDLEGVELKAVVLSPDSRNAKVHFMVPRGRSRSAVERAFIRATGFLRGRLVDGIELKRAPDLKFVFDGEIASKEDKA
jgi:ribosome-binding factor A